MRSTEDLLRELVVDELGLRPQDVTTEARFLEDFGTDSLERLELTRRVEETFGLEIPDGDADALLTFGQLVTYVAARMEKEQ